MGNIYHTSGNVGIGTSTPGASLDVNGNVMIRGYDSILNIENNNPYAGGGGSLVFGHIQSGNNTPMASIKGSLVDGGGAGFRAGDLKFFTSNTGSLTEKMILTKDGKLGIGVASPSTTLDVNGEARSSTSTTSSSDAKTLTTKDYVDSQPWYTKTLSSSTPPIGTIVIAAINLPFASHQTGASNTGNTNPGNIGSTIAANTLKTNGSRYGWGASHPYSTSVTGTWTVVCYMDEDGGTTDQAWVMLVRTA